MKGRIYIIILVLIAFLFAACTADSEPEKSMEPTENIETENSAPTIKPTEELAMDKTSEYAEQEPETETKKEEDNTMKLQIGDNTFTATLSDNSSAEALAEMLKEGPVTVKMKDYGSMEKVGSLGSDLPRNDEQITTEPGDIILYQGSAIVIYYAPNSWNFTRLGKIDDVTQEELLNALGKGNVNVTFSID